jgi:cell migration-inducing and hyaluronan-binding protein
VNATQINLQAAPGWAVGQQIVIASTDYVCLQICLLLSEADSVLQGRVVSDLTSYPDQSETRIINAINGATITLDRPLTYMHWGVAPQAAEVAMLNRNIVIRGDASSDASTFGGHVMVRGTAASAHVKGVEFYRMGQAGLLGRYPFHFHMMGDKRNTGQFVSHVRPTTGSVLLIVDVSRRSTTAISAATLFTPSAEPSSITT